MPRNGFNGTAGRRFALFITLGFIALTVVVLVVWRVWVAITERREPVGMERAASELDFACDPHVQPAMQGSHFEREVRVDLLDDMQVYTVTLEDGPACQLCSGKAAGPPEAGEVDFELGRDALNDLLRTRRASPAMAMRVLAREERLFHEGLA